MLADRLVIGDVVLAMAEVVSCLAAAIPAVVRRSECLSYRLKDMILAGAYQHHSVLVCTD